MTILTASADLAVRCHRMEPQESWPLLPAEEIGWLLVEAGSRLRAGGSGSVALGLGEAGALGRLGHDPRLQQLASDLAGLPQEPARIGLTRAAQLRPTRQLALHVELGGAPDSRPGRVHRAPGTIPAEALVLTVTFRACRSITAEACRPPVLDLWPPAAVVAG